MIRIPIDLAEPFEKVLAAALSLPRTDNAWPSDAVIKRAVRYLYEAANGRIVETHIGAIPIAPAVQPSLKAGPLCLKSAAELVTMVKDNLGESDGLDCIRPKPHKPRQANIGSALFEFMAGRLARPNAGLPQETLSIPMAPRVRCHTPPAGGKTKAEKRCPHVLQLFLVNTTATQSK